jgi:hypothetical protein
VATIQNPELTCDFCSESLGCGAPVVDDARVGTAPLGGDTARRHIRRGRGSIAAVIALASLAGCSASSLVSAPKKAAGSNPPSSSAPSSAAGNSLHVAEPVSNVMGANFNETVSGSAASPADHLVAWEQFYKNAGCAATYADEKSRESATTTYALTIWLDQAVTPGQSYSAVAHFSAQRSGTHGLCAYLINKSTGTTYAYDGIWWDNHN